MWYFNLASSLFSSPCRGSVVFLDFSRFSRFSLFLSLPTDSSQRDGQTPVILSGLMRTSLHIFSDLGTGVFSYFSVSSSTSYCVSLFSSSAFSLLHTQSNGPVFLQVHVCLRSIISPVPRRPSRTVCLVNTTPSAWKLLPYWF